MLGPARASPFRTDRPSAPRSVEAMHRRLQGRRMESRRSTAQQTLRVSRSQWSSDFRLGRQRRIGDSSLNSSGPKSPKSPVESCVVRECDLDTNLALARSFLGSAPRALLIGTATTKGPGASSAVALAHCSLPPESWWLWPTTPAWWLHVVWKAADRRLQRVGDNHGLVMRGAKRLGRAYCGRTADDASSRDASSAGQALFGLTRRSTARIRMGAAGC